MKALPTFRLRDVRTDKEKSCVDAYAHYRRFFKEDQPITLADLLRVEYRNSYDPMTREEGNVLGDVCWFIENLQPELKPAWDKAMRFLLEKKGDALFDSPKSNSEIEEIIECLKSYLRGEGWDI